MEASTTLSRMQPGTCCGRDKSHFVLVPMWWGGGPGFAGEMLLAVTALHSALLLSREGGRERFREREENTSIEGERGREGRRERRESEKRV